MNSHRSPILLAHLCQEPPKCWSLHELISDPAISSLPEATQMLILTTVYMNSYLILLDHLCQEPPKYWSLLHELTSDPVSSSLLEVEATQMLILTWTHIDLWSCELISARSHPNADPYINAHLWCIHSIQVHRNTIPLPQLTSHFYLDGSTHWDKLLKSSNSTTHSNSHFMLCRPKAPDRPLF